MTGRSSTGKSALIEIFDYCFGASEFTVPVGVITDCADVYFVAMRVKQSCVVLSRSDKLGGKCLIQEFTDEDSVHPAKLNLAKMLNPDELVTAKEHVKRISRLFGLTVTDVDEDLKDREARPNNARKGTPSARSFSSFMLQHQNLVANKHALFYRFDEQKKREPVIEQFLIFLGLVDGDYFQLRQNLAEKKRELEALNRFGLPEATRVRDEAKVVVVENLDRYAAASGTRLEIGDWVVGPMEAIKRAEEAELYLDPLSVEHLEIRAKIESEKSSLMAERRENERQLRLIDSTQQQIVEYEKKAEIVPMPAQGTEGGSYCYFCGVTHHGVDAQSNLLSEAIDWLNGELAKLRVLPLQLAEDRNVLERKLHTNTQELQAVGLKLSALDQQVADLESKRSHLEVAMKAKLGVIQALQTMAHNPVFEIEEKIERLGEEIKQMESNLKERYDTVDLRSKVEKRLHSLMKEIGDGFDFEASYTPINLHFDVETFELWAAKGDQKVFLRSMGSGANWLSCHLTLFLALHRYFCELGNKCVIPSILFLDQPSQVYFPAILDTDEDFSPEKIVERSAAAHTRVRPVDEDVQAVAKLFSKLVKFCADTKTATGIEPQIIVTDHADKLKLEGEFNFDKLVRAKWRGDKDGLIRISSESSKDAVEIDKADGDDKSSPGGDLI